MIKIVIILISCFFLLTAPAFACQVCVMDMMSHAIPFIYPWSLLMLFFFLWDLLVLLHMKLVCREGEREFIELRYKNIKVKDIILLAIAFFLSFFAMLLAGPPFFIVLAGLVVFFRSFTFRANIPFLPSYSLKTRYLVMNIALIIMMILSFYLAYSYVPGMPVWKLFSSQVSLKEALF